MSNRFYKNFIMCGIIDFHCLLCKESFIDIPEVERHIRWEHHRRIVVTQTRSSKFPNDHIYKIGEKFYCESCNCLLLWMEKVTQHIESENHMALKKSPKTEENIINVRCARDSEYVIVGNLIVQNIHWNGIVDDMCVVCCDDFTKPLEHINKDSHILNLIDSEIVFIDNETCYRKLNIDYIYCFTCKSLVSLQTLSEHWISAKHMNMKRGIFRMTNLESKKSEVMQKLLESQKDFYEFKEDGTSMCFRCNSVINTDIKLMLSHNKTHDDDEPRVPALMVEYDSSSGEDSDSEEEVEYRGFIDHGKRRSELAAYGKPRYIRLNAGGSRGYCEICHVLLSAHIRFFKEHVKGHKHRGHLELMGIKKPRHHAIPEVNYKSITEFMEFVHISRPPMIVLWLNKDFCLDIKSFILVSDVEKYPHRRVTKCFACDTYYPTGSDAEHYKTDEHKRKFLGAKVLCCPGEFVREVRPDVYHCGICNKVFPFWEHLKKHLKNEAHINKRNERDLKIHIGKAWLDQLKMNTPSKIPDIAYVQIYSFGLFHNS